MTFPSGLPARRTGTALIVATALPAAATFVSGAPGHGEGALARGHVFGTTPADPPETVSFILKARDLAALAADFGRW